MKQTKTKLKFTILDDGKILPLQVQLKVKLQNDSIQGLTFDEWIKRLINNKLIINPSDNRDELVSILEPFFVGIFVAKEAKVDYLMTQIEFMLKTLINENLIEFIYECNC